MSFLELPQKRLSFVELPDKRLIFLELLKNFVKNFSGKLKYILYDIHRKLGIQFSGQFISSFPKNFIPKKLLVVSVYFWDVFVGKVSRKVFRDLPRNFFP